MKNVVLRSDLYAGCNDINNTLVLNAYIIDVLKLEYCKEMRSINNENNRVDGLQKVCIARKMSLSPLLLSVKKLSLTTTFHSTLRYGFLSILYTPIKFLVLIVCQKKTIRCLSPVRLLKYLMLKYTR